MIKLADFGLGKPIETLKYAQDSEVIGAAVYMAPEFFKANKPKYKKSVDIWAFGCVVFELLHFKRLFAGANYPIQLKNVCDDIRRPFEDDCPDKLKQLVIDCTKKEPKERLSVDGVVDRITQIKGSIIDSIRLVNSKKALN